VTIVVVTVVVATAMLVVVVLRVVMIVIIPTAVPKLEDLRDLHASSIVFRWEPVPSPTPRPTRRSISLFEVSTPLDVRVILDDGLVDQVAPTGLLVC
jgi:hypothetical protein